MSKAPLSELIFKKYHWMTGHIISQVQQSQVPDLTNSQAIILAAISQGEHRPSAIAKQLGTSRQAVYKTMKELQLKELVVQRQDDTHQKAVVAELTERGIAADKLADAVSKEMEKNLTDEFGEESVILLRKMLAAAW
ncbi:MAG: MarR family winged helix-turn-helix transcriptional regulator [Oleispira sp.]